MTVVCVHDPPGPPLKKAFPSLSWLVLKWLGTGLGYWEPPAGWRRSRTGCTGSPQPVSTTAQISILGADTYEQIVEPQ